MSDVDPTPPATTPSSGPPPGPPAPPAADPPDAAAGRASLKPLVVAALLGLPVSAAAIVFTSIVHALTDVVWTDIPNDAGWSQVPWWYVLAIPTIAGALVYAATLLPGRGGHSPLEGLGLSPLTPVELIGGLLAAMASLVFGIVLGPEAPLTALGLTMGMVAGRLAGLDANGVKVVSLAGAFAAIATIFGGPLPSSLLLFEAIAASGAIASIMIGRALVPGLIAAGIGALLFTGVDDWSGVHGGGLGQLSLPTYGPVRLLDVVWGIVVALGAGIVVVTAQRSAAIVGRRASRIHPLRALMVGGFLVGALAILFRALTDKPIDLILFSGEASIGTYAAEGSAGVLLAVVLIKGVAYAISLGAGFRGGPIFPSVALGVAVGALLGGVLPGAALTPAVIAGLAAGPAAAMRLPFFGALLAALLGGTASKEAIPIAVLAAVTGWLVGVAADQLTARRAAPAEAHT